MAFAEACEGEFKCEFCRVSRFSPGPVEDQEYLLFLVTDPQVKLVNNRIQPQALKLVGDKGISTLREQADDEEIYETWRAMTTNGKERRFQGVFRFRAGAVRRSHNPRKFGIFDTGEEKRPHHADILTMTAHSISTRELERLKKDASQALSEAPESEFIPASEFRTGKFANLQIP